MKRVWISVVILFLILIIAQASFAKGTVRLYLFYSQEAGGLKVEDEIIKPLSQKYPIEVQSFPVDQLKNYDLLIKFEKEWKVKESELPAVIIGDKILGGESEIKRDLEGLVRLYAGKGGTDWPSVKEVPGQEEGWIPRAPTEAEKESGKIIYAAFLYMPGCLHCEEMKAEMKKWAVQVPNLRIRMFSLVKEENKKLDEALSQIYQVPESKRLADHKLYMGEDYLWSSDLHHESFQKIVGKYQGKGAPPPWERVTEQALEKGEKSIIERFKRWSLSAVLVAGFIDGINPCAFATMIFLVSYLTFAGKKSREILLYGTIFTSGVFIAYVLVGMGLMTFLHQMSVFPFVSKGIYLFIAFFALTLGIITLYDYILFKRGQVAKWTLQLPMGLKKKIHEIIREQARFKGGLLATFGAGFIIAVCTVICTGQVYLPTIGFVMSIPELKKHAIFNLILYNVMYIVPLVGVFVLTFFGVTSEKMAFVTKKHTGTVKLLTALLFMGLGVFIFFVR